MKLIFDQNMLAHINTASVAERGKASQVLRLAEALLGSPIFITCVWLLERAASFLLTLPVPIYSALIYAWVTQARGLPHMGGMYLRGLYYSQKLKRMESNVFIDQGVFFAYPKGVELKEFSYIDKNVIVMSKTAKVGRRVHIAPNVFVSGGGTFEIEDYACIATNTSVITSTEILRDGARCSGPMTSADQRNVMRGSVSVKKDAFVGPNVTLLPNVVVAAGSVVAAGVTLSKSTEEWGVYVAPKPKIISQREPVKFSDN